MDTGRVRTLRTNPLPLPVTAQEVVGAITQLSAKGKLRLHNREGGLLGLVLLHKTQDLSANHYHDSVTNNILVADVLSHLTTNGCTVLGRLTGEIKVNNFTVVLTACNNDV